MPNKYSQPSIAGATRFSKSPMANVEFSRMTANPRCFTTYNAGDIVPIYCAEVLPHDTISMKVDFVNRLSSAVIKPTMGTMQIDLYAFFVQNRVVNESWKNVQGENSSGFWTAPEVNLAPLYSAENNTDVTIPVGSVADYYGFPTQAPLKAQHLQQMNDLKFRGYLEIYNEYFRDQNYQPPIAYSKLNVYNGFLEPFGSSILFNGSVGAGSMNVSVKGPADGSFADGALLKAVYGEGYNEDEAVGSYFSVFPRRLTGFSALDKPLKANKLHDAFTSVLPSPQKGPDIYFGVADGADITFDVSDDAIAFPSGKVLKLLSTSEQSLGTQNFSLNVSRTGNQNTLVSGTDTVTLSGQEAAYNGTNLIGFADLSKATGITINEFRTAVATQQVYETLARGGTRYLSMLRSFFEIEAESPFADKPEELGHIRRELDLFQVAQTSASQEGNTPQGDLAAFGYTASQGDFFTKTFLEHGYIHVVAVVRHRNIYSTYLAPDNFRKNTLDFYLPQLANIGEQPIRLATLNPFVADDQNKTLGFQEAWWEYRYEPDRVTGEFRTGLNNGLDIWTYADPFDADFDVVNGAWLKSNSQEVLDRTLAVTSQLANQFIGMFSFEVDKQRPMPTYSVPGLDTI